MTAHTPPSPTPPSLRPPPPHHHSPSTARFCPKRGQFFAFFSEFYCFFLLKFPPSKLRSTGRRKFIFLLRTRPIMDNSENVWAVTILKEVSWWGRLSWMYVILPRKEISEAKSDGRKRRKRSDYRRFRHRSIALKGKSEASGWEPTKPHSPLLPTHHGISFSMYL